MNNCSLDITALDGFDRLQLVEAWIKAFGEPPFKGARKANLVRGLAYHHQCQTSGGLPNRTQKKLLKIARLGESGGSVAKTLLLKTKPGTQLVREWNGRTYKVDVTYKGYVLNGAVYSSLSAAAKAITGSHRSGPRFFGVRG